MRDIVTELNSDEREQLRQYAAAAISGLMANQHVVEYKHDRGWGLCNCNPAQVTSFAMHIAKHMLAAEKNETNIENELQEIAKLSEDK